MHNRLGFIENLPKSGKYGDRKIIGNKTRKENIEFFIFYQSRCLDLGLKTSAITINRILILLNKSKGTYGQLRYLATELHGRIKDEMAGALFLSLTAQEAKHYTDPTAGWVEIMERFPNTVRDIEEAYKCFALSRDVAAVFHVLRVIEEGLFELGKFIRVTDPKSGWSAVTKRLKQIMETKYEERTEFEKEHFAFLEQVHGTVAALKDAWRNKINHAGEKPYLMVSDIAPNVAEEILMASRAFMRGLAAGLPVPPGPDEYVPRDEDEPPDEFVPPDEYEPL